MESIVIVFSPGNKVIFTLQFLFTYLSIQKGFSINLTGWGVTSFQIYVVRILREGQLEPSFVFRTFDEFQELHNKLSIIFPLWKLPGYVIFFCN